MIDDGYHVAHNDRLIQLQSGRLLFPCAFHDCEDGIIRKPFALALIYYSDDEGESWALSEQMILGPLMSRSGLQEPGLVELSDGNVLLWASTDLGAQYQCVSSDGGMTWSRPKPSGLIGPSSPASIKRHPMSRALVAIHNDHSGRYAHLEGSRAPLVALVSTDETRTWSPILLIEKSITGWFCYSSILFAKRGLYLSYIAGNKRIGLFFGRQKVVFISNQELI